MMRLGATIGQTAAPVHVRRVDPKGATCYTATVPLYGPQCGYITAPSINVKRIATFPIFLPDPVPSHFFTFRSIGA